jgi:hypothetical protein
MAGSRGTISRMSDIGDTINEAVEHASESRLNSIIAALVAIAATFMVKKYEKVKDRHQDKRGRTAEGV